MGPTMCLGETLRYLQYETQIESDVKSVVFLYGLPVRKFSNEQTFLQPV